MRLLFWAFLRQRTDLFRLPEPVSDPRFGGYMPRTRRILLDLFPQITYGDTQHLGLFLMCTAPYLPQYLAVGHHLVRMDDEQRRRQQG